MIVNLNYSVVDVPTKEIFSDEHFNCRGEKITPFDVGDLAEDIAKHGLHQPIIVQPFKGALGKKYRIIIGHRRFQAFLNLKKETIPSIIREGLTEEQALVMNLSENIKRKNLNIYQEAKAIERLKLHGATMQEVANLLEVSLGWVQIRYALLELPYEIQMEAAAGYLSQTNIRDIHGLPKDKQYEITREIKDFKIKNENKGFKVKKEPKKRVDAERKQKQTEHTIFRMQDFILDTLGPNLATRTLAWCAGIISTNDLLADIQNECLDSGKSFTRPDWVI